MPVPAPTSGGKTASLRNPSTRPSSTICTMPNTSLPLPNSLKSNLPPSSFNGVPKSQKRTRRDCVCLRPSWSLKVKRDSGDKREVVLVNQLISARLWIMNSMVKTTTQRSRPSAKHPTFPATTASSVIDPRKRRPTTSSRRRSSQNSILPPSLRSVPAQ